jgi:hypothetical protein
LQLDLRGNLVDFETLETLRSRLGTRFSYT